MDAEDIPFLPPESNPKDPITFNLKVMLARFRHQHLLKQVIFGRLWEEAEHIEQRLGHDFR